MIDTKSRPETTDAHGTKHRHGCPATTWAHRPSTLPGWAWAQCLACGAQRLDRTPKDAR